LYGARVRSLLPRLAPALDGLERVEVHLGELLRQQPRALLLGVALSLLIELLIVLQYHVLLGAFGVSLALPTLLLVLLGGGLANAAPTPAGLGALEAAQVALVGLASGRPDIGLVVGVIVRLHETLLLGIGLAALSYQGVSLARLRLGVQRAAG
ncbi:MAG: lysylphosphatidylglycerol synthase domain-containing protein, partial [Candidatus Binatia bacterium]